MKHNVKKNTYIYGDNSYLGGKSTFAFNQARILSNTEPNISATFNTTHIDLRKSIPFLDYPNKSYKCLIIDSVPEKGI